MLQRARGLAALVVLIVLGGGVPVALARFVGRPWPSPLPAPEVIWQSVSSGDISDGVANPVAVGASFERHGLVEVHAARWVDGQERHLGEVEPG